MLRARSLSVAIVVVSSLLGVSCASIAPSDTPAATAPASALVSVATFGAVSPLPSVSAGAAIGTPPDAPTVTPTNAPTAAPINTPSATRKPSQKPTKAAVANLVVTKFEIDADVLLVETPFDVLVTFRNEGDADAGPFQGAVEELNTDDTGQPVFDPFDVDGQIAPGDSRNISLSVTVQQAGNWTFTAIADFQNEVAESNENDNSRQVQALVRSGLPDFQWANGEGFSFTPSQTKPGTYDVSLDFINKGTSDYDGQPLFIGYTWYRDEGGSGDFPPVPMGDLPVNEERTLTQNVQSPGPGTYTIYAILDKDHLADQLNYDNDESSIRLTVN